MKPFILHFTAMTLALSAFAAEPAVKVTFVRFGANTGYGQCAVLNVTNFSRQAFEYFTDGCIMKDPATSCDYMGRGCFVSQSPTGQVIWRQPPVGPGPIHRLLPGSATNITVLLPQDGRTGRVAVLQKVGPTPPDYNWPWVECDQPIQCADATPPRIHSVPPRLLPRAEGAP